LATVSSTVTSIFTATATRTTSATIPTGQVAKTDQRTAGKNKFDGADWNG